MSTISNSKNELREICNLTLLVRGADKARRFNEKGFKTVLFDSLEETEEVESIASNYDCMRPGVNGLWYSQTLQALTYWQ